MKTESLPAAARHPAILAPNQWRMEHFICSDYASEWPVQAVSDMIVNLLRDGDTVVVVPKPERVGMPIMQVEISK